MSPPLAILRRRLPPHRPLGRFGPALVALSLLGFSCTVTVNHDHVSDRSIGLPGRLPGQADVPRDRPLRVGFLVVDGVYNSELMAPYDIFQHTVFHTDPGMEVFTVSPNGKPVKTFEGLTVAAHHSFATAPPIDVLVVPSAEHSMDSDLENVALIAWVRNVGGKASFVVSLCDGAFVLAKAGLLDDVASTTFPGDVDRYEETFPQLDVRRDVSFVHDGKALTSQGGAKSYDVAMYLVDHIWGEKVARGIGSGLIIPWPPAPGSMSAAVIPAASH
jgi:transcriptional regulator GlxA family with amidase domain